jgi:1-acyl-sn-glycerol-3-phosphate acyltransferase
MFHHGWSVHCRPATPKLSASIVSAVVSAVVSAARGDYRTQAVAPSPIDTLREVSARVHDLEIDFNRYGVDRFGTSRKHLRQALIGLCGMYRHYFRSHVHGIDNVPLRGRAMLIGNHAGGVALDASMVIASLFLEMNPPRLAQGMAEKFLNRVPFLSIWTYRTGQLTGLPRHAEKLLDDERLLMVFPEGARGTAKLYKDRHSLVAFGTGFMRLALQTGTPIVPLAFVGGGEAIPTVYNAVGLGKLFGAPYVPITPYLLPIPMPVRLDIVYGEPMLFEGDGNEDDRVIAAYVEQVKSTIGGMIDEGRQYRRNDSKD